MKRNVLKIKKSLAIPGLLALCLAINVTGLGQQLSSQVNAQAEGASGSSMVQSNVQPSIRPLPTTKMSGGGISESGFASTATWNEQSISTNHELQTSPGVKTQGAFGGSTAGHGGISPGFAATGESGMGRPSTLNNASKPLHVSSSAGDGMTAGQFPDSTRDEVLPSPLLSGNSLVFFSTGEPQFSTSFNARRHLNPSYAVGAVGTGRRSKSKRHSSLDQPWTNGLQTSFGTTFGSQTSSSAIHDSLKGDPLADPLKSQSSSLLNSIQPN